VVEPDPGHALAACYFAPPATGSSFPPAPDAVPGLVEGGDHLQQRV